MQGKPVTSVPPLSTFRHNQYRIMIIETVFSSTASGDRQSTFINHRGLMEDLSALSVCLSSLVFRSNFQCWWYKMLTNTTGNLCLTSFMAQTTITSSLFVLVASALDERPRVLLIKFFPVFHVISYPLFTGAPSVVIRARQTLDSGRNFTSSILDFSLHS